MRKELPQLSKMSNEAKDDLIRELWEEIQGLRILKTSRNEVG